MGPNGRWRRRRLVVPVLAVALSPLFVVVAARANPPESSGLWELDKNVQNNVSTSFLGALNSNINAATTSFVVCQNASANPGTPITIQVDAEQMTVGAIANASGGGCTGTFKRTYSSVTRGANGTAAAAHAQSG